VYSEEKLNRFLDDLASGAPTPGGGSSAALVGAVGAALVSMVGNFTVGRPKFEAVEARAREVLERTEALRARLVDLIQADIDAFDEVSAAYKLPRATDEEKAARTAAIQASLVTATEAPLAIARAANEILSLCTTMAAIGNPQTISDVGVGALAADACLRSAALNVEINLKHMKDEARIAVYREEMDRLLEGGEARLSGILAVVRERL
jgi:formiminotetrahydrofolate cyclodeaminase